MASFWAELSRRRVFKVVAVYLIVAWLLAQVIDVLNEPLRLPLWFDTVAIVLLAMGLPIAIVLAWAFDITPQGVVRTGAFEGDPVNRASPERAEQNSSQRARHGHIGPTKEPMQASTEDRPGLIENSVAVLPFANISPDPDDAYFAVGIHDEILNQLAKIKGLRVIARTSVLRYAGGEKSIPEIARKLKVRTVMEGTVRYAGDRIRITAQLIDAARDTPLWSDTFDRELKDIFEIQTDIAKRIANALTVELSLAEQKSIESHPTESTEAYQLYLRAIAIYREGDSAIGVTAPPGKRSGIQSYLDKVIALDPTFALAYAWKAWIYTFSRAYDPIQENAWLSRSSELDDQARQNAEKALAIDPKLGLAHAALAKVHLYQGTVAAAAAAFESALTSSPNDPDVLRSYANFHWFAGRYQDAIQCAGRAVELDPDNALSYDVLGRVCHSAGTYDAAIAAFRKSIEISPGAPINYVSLARPELAQGNEGAAVDALRIADHLMPSDASPGVRADLANGYGRLGQREDAQRAFDKIKEMAAERYVDPASWAFAYLAVADCQRARDELNKIIASPALVSNPFTLMFIKENAWSDPVLEQPEFVEMRNRLGFQS